MALEKKKKALELIANTNAINILKDKATYRTEREMNLTHFRELMHIFQRVSKNGKKSMNMEEFKAAFGLVLGQGLSEDQMAQLFMKIDANTDNTVDWDEFSTFMLLRAERQSMMLEEATTTLFDLPPPLIPVPHHQTPHREGIVSIFYIASAKNSHGQNTRASSLDSLKIKNPADLKDVHLQNGRWVHDLVYMSNCNKFALASDDHEITFYDFTTMEPQVSLDLQDSIALCLDFWCDPDNPDSDEGILLYGTDQGYVVTFNFINGALFSRNKVKSQSLQINMETYLRSGSFKNFGTVTKRKAHSDWVTRVKYYHDFHSIVSCSPDPQESLVVATQDGKNKWNYFSAPVHRGVNVFAYCKFPVCLVTGGTDRQLRLWNPYRLHHPMAALKGHNAPIIDITINELNGQILSLSSDKVIKVWDIRKQQCLQTIVDNAQLKADETISVIHFNPFLSGKLLAAATCLIEYNLKAKGPSISFASSKSHENALRSALFNVNFRQIVTACDGGVYIDLKDHQYVVATSCNRKVAVFLDDNDLLKLYPSFTYPADPNATHGWHVDDIISMAFCKPNYLVTGGYDGEIILTNFQSGHIIHRMKWPGAEEKDNPNKSVDKENPVACSLLSSGADGFIRWWNVTTGELYWEMDATNGRGEGVYSMCTNENNRFLAISDAIGNVKVFDISDTCIDEREIIVQPELISSFRAHTKCVVSIEFMDGEFLLTASTDGTARIFTAQGDFVGTLGQDNLWDLSIPESYCHPLRPPDVEVLLARERLYAKRFKEVTHKLVLNLREHPSGKEGVIYENESLSRIPSGLSSLVSRSTGNLSMADMSSDAGFTSFASASRSSSLFSSMTSLPLGSVDECRNRPIATAEALTHGYSTWYGSTKFAKEQHLRQPKKRDHRLPKILDNPNRTYHNLKPHDLNEVVDVRSIPILSTLSQRGASKGIGLLFDTHVVEARSHHATRGGDGGKGKDKGLALGALIKTNSLEVILNKMLPDV
ncbi:WD40 repeat domain 95 [Dinochytrium kinnereticum]|nr:WD40 repeat domain 95 [Dinochytrium kinnereticum]